ncbi:MAG: endonuclease/exonuclease/phosphatase family protein, partial [Microgenomates group bacterium]
ESTRRYIEITLGVAPGQAIRIGNVYPSYPIPVPILGSKGWEDETTTLVELINERKPTILGGDLNASPSSSRVRRIMEETNLVSIPDGFEEKTWIGRGAIRKQSGRKRLDYLFGNPDFVDGAGVIHEAGPSDHRPIIGTFNLEV